MRQRISAIVLRRLLDLGVHHEESPILVISSEFLRRIVIPFNDKVHQKWSNPAFRPHNALSLQAPNALYS
jgi:hypothetical protein